MVAAAVDMLIPCIPVVYTQTAYILAVDILVLCILALVGYISPEDNRNPVSHCNLG